MKQFVAIAACGLSLAACSSMPSWMQLDTAKPAPAATTMQLESEPAGADARTSFGQSCRTPCSVAVTGTEFTVSFSLPGYQPQTVPVRLVGPSEDNRDPTAEGESAAPRLVPNPVFVELQRAGPPPAARKRTAAPPKKKPAASSTTPAGAAKPAGAARPAARPAAQPPAAPAPEAAPASPWPPPPTR